MESQFKVLLNLVFDPMNTEILRKTCLDLFTFSASFLSVCIDEPYRGLMIWTGLMACTNRHALRDRQRQADHNGTDKSLAIKH